MNPVNIARDGMRPKAEHRAADRRPVVVPGRITWKDAQGATRFASVVTRDVSELGVFIEWRESAAIPLYRLVHFQVEREACEVEGLPVPLRSGKVLSAVYRVGSHRRSTGTPEGYGLRLLVEPRRKAVSAPPESPALEATAIA